MLKIEYEIMMNDTGRPCIELSEDYEENKEDKFLAFELARYFLQRISPRTKELLDEESVGMVDTCIALLGQISDEMSHIIWNDMKMLGDVDFQLNTKYHLRVADIEGLYNLGEYSAMEGKIYKKQEGLMVLVVDEAVVYKLVDNSWEVIKYEE